MRFAVVDMEGSTLDTFEDASSAVAFLVVLLHETPAAADEVGVVEYEEGQRVGSPIFAEDFIARSRTAYVQAVIARALQNVRIDPAAVLTIAPAPSHALIDIAVPPAGADHLDAMVRQSRSHRFPLAA